MYDKIKRASLAALPPCGTKVPLNQLEQNKTSAAAK